MMVSIEERQLVFETKRLRAYVATIEDADLFYSLWKNPRVMHLVGFPNGLPITYAEIVEQLAGQSGQILDARLVVMLRGSDESIGECKVGHPNDAGISTTDVKLLPEYWGNKYGVEIKKALLDYLFTHTTCSAVEASPNVNNIASIKMQEAVGGVRVGEYTFEPPEEKQSYSIAVHAYIYRVYRAHWERMTEVT